MMETSSSTGVNYSELAMAKLTENDDDDEQEIIVTTITSFQNPGLQSKAAIWKYFLQSVNRNEKTRRYQAKCRYCNQEMDGKTQRMEKHTLSCRKTPSAKKADMYTKLRQSSSSSVCFFDDAASSAAASSAAASSAAASSSSSVSSIANSPKQKSIQSFYGPAVLSKSLENDYSLSLLRAIIFGHVSMNFVDSFYFQEFVRKLKPSWSMPSPSTLMDNHLIKLFARALENRDSKFVSENVFTLLLDGWTDVSANSIYGLMLLHSFCESDVLDILNLSTERHTAENILTQVTESVESSIVSWDQIKCCVTDSPTAMVKFRRILNEAHPHIIILPCGLHVINLLAKDLCKYEKSMPIVKANCVIVNFFTSSHIWFNNSKEWIKNNNGGKGKHSLDSLCETRWYSMTKVCLGISVYEEFFLQAVQREGMDDKHPKIKNAIKDCIKRRHFIDNADLLLGLKPIADVIGTMESSSTHIGLLILSIINLHQQYEASEDNEFVNHAKLSLSRRFKQYFLQPPIYFVVLFLWPMYRDFTISKKFTFEWIKRETLKVAKSWKFSKNDCILIIQSLTQYVNTPEDQFMMNLDPIIFWNSTAKFHPPMRQLAVMLFKVKGHAAPVETLFSGMSYTKTKTRNRMNVENLKMFTMIRKDLLHSLPESNKKNRKRKINSDIATNISPPPPAIAAPEENSDHVTDLVAEFEDMLLDDSVNEEEAATEDEIPFSINDVFDFSKFNNGTTESNNSQLLLPDINHEEKEDFSIEDILNL